MNDQKKTLPFHITIKHGDEVIIDIDTNGIIAAASTGKEEQDGGTATHILTECNTIRLMGLIGGITQAKTEVVKKISADLGELITLTMLKDAIKDE